MANLKMVLGALKTAKALGTDFLAKKHTKDMTVEKNSHTEQQDKEKNRNEEAMAEKSMMREAMQHIHEQAAKTLDENIKNSDWKGKLFEDAYQENKNLHQNISNEKETRIEEIKKHSRELKANAKELSQAHLATKDVHISAIYQQYQQVYARNDITNTYIGEVINNAIDNLEELRKNDKALLKELNKLNELELENKNINNEFVILEHEIDKLTAALKEQEIEYRTLKNKGHIDELSTRACSMLNIVKEINDQKSKLIRVRSEKQLSDESVSTLKDVIEVIQENKESALLEIRAAQEATRVINLQAQQIDQAYSQSHEFLDSDYKPEEKDITPSMDAIESVKADAIEHSADSDPTPAYSDKPVEEPTVEKN